MKIQAIKTIAIRLDNADEFDEKVNEALMAGWTLVKRSITRPDQPNDGRTYFHTMLYAELVKTDAATEHGQGQEKRHEGDGDGDA